MLTKKEVSKLSEKDRKALLDKTLGVAVDKIRDVAVCMSYLSELSVNTMSIRARSSESIANLLKETCRIAEEENAYYE